MINEHVQLKWQQESLATTLPMLTMSSIICTNSLRTKYFAISKHYINNIISFAIIKDTESITQNIFQKYLQVQVVSLVISNKKLRRLHQSYKTPSRK